MFDLSIEGAGVQHWRGLRGESAKREKYLPSLKKKLQTTNPENTKKIQKNLCPHAETADWRYVLLRLFFPTRLAGIFHPRNKFHLWRGRGTPQICTFFLTQNQVNKRRGATPQFRLPFFFLEKRGTRTTFHKNISLFIFLPRLELMGEAGGKGGAEFFLKNANLYKFNQQHRRYFSLNLV